MLCRLCSLELRAPAELLRRGSPGSQGLATLTSLTSLGKASHPMPCRPMHPFLLHPPMLQPEQCPHSTQCDLSMDLPPPALAVLDLYSATEAELSACITTPTSLRHLALSADRRWVVGRV